MGIEFKGGGPADAGPAGLVARFMVATTTGEHEMAMGLLSEKSRESARLHDDPMEGAVITFGEMKTEGDQFIVPTIIEHGGESDEIDFVVIEEGGDLRVDMDLTMTRQMGFDPEELLDQMGDSIAEGMGQMMEGVVGAMAEGMSAMGEAMGAIAGEAGEEAPGTPPEEDEEHNEEGPGEQGARELPGQM